MEKFFEDGLLTTLSWGDSMFRQAATAFIQDEIQKATGDLDASKLPFADKALARHAATLIVCLPHIRGATTSISTNNSQNFLKLALQEAAAQALQSSQYLQQAMDTAHADLAKVREALKAEQLPPTSLAPVSA